MRNNGWAVGLAAVALTVGGSAGPSADAGARARRPQAERSLDPMPMEAFALRPGTRLVWTRTIGMLESEDATATIAAIVLANPAAAPSRMRGLRIDLRHRTSPRSCNLRFLDWSVMCARPNAALFYEADQLERVRDGIRRGVAEAHEPNGIVSMHSSVRGSGVLITGYNFYGVTVEALAELFTQGMAALDAAR